MLKAWWRRLRGGRNASPGETLTGGNAVEAQASAASFEAMTTPAGDRSLDLVALRQRVAALESDFVDVLQEWVRTREQWVRYLKRQGAIRAKAEAGDEMPELGDLGEVDDNQLDLEVFRAKFGR